MFNGRDGDRKIWDKKMKDNYVSAVVEIQSNFAMWSPNPENEVRRG